MNDIPTILLWVGMALLGLGLFPSTFLKQVVYLIGVVTLVVAIVGNSFVHSGTYVPPISPHPVPSVPVVDTGLAKQATAAFKGTKAEAQELAATCQGIAIGLTFDAIHNQPVVTDTRKFGEVAATFQEYARQQNRPTDFGTKFADVESIISKALKSPQPGFSEGLTPANTVPMDSARRAGISKIYMEVATGLQLVK